MASASKANYHRFDVQAGVLDWGQYMLEELMGLYQYLYKMDRSIVASCICAKNTCATGRCSRASTSEDSSFDDASFHFTRPKVGGEAGQKLQGLQVIRAGS